MFKNCWTYAGGKFRDERGWLLVRFTRRSKSESSKYVGWVGDIMVVCGVILINFGAWIRTGSWLHAYHAKKVSGPYTSYEPILGPPLKRPPVTFEGIVVETQKLN